MIEATEQPATESEPLEAPASPENEGNFFDRDDDDGSSEAISDTAEVIDDSEEIDYEGEKYKVPAKLKEAFLRQADYTTKTQGLAQQRQDFEAAQQQFVARQQFQEQYLDALSEVKSIDRQLAQYQKLDWNALTDADPVQALKLDRQMRELQQQRTAQVDGIQRAQQQHQHQTSQATARGLETARAQLAREITGYGTPEVQQGMMAAAKAMGYKPEELANVNDPRPVKLLHKAYLYDKLMAQRTATPAVVAKPITRVTGGSATTTKSLGDANLSDAEYNRMRREYISKNR